MNKLDTAMDRSSICTAFDVGTIIEMAERFSRVLFGEGDIICREGDAGDCMYLIMRGEVAILKDMGWGQRELKRLRDGEVFGEMSVISKAQRSATVQARSPVECLKVSEDEFKELYDENKTFARQVLRMMSDRLARTDEKSIQELVGSHRALIFALAQQADARDPETGAHLERTRKYCARLSELLSEKPEYEYRITPGFIEGIFHLSPLHDIGKVAVPDAILLKPGRLTMEEFEVMKGHAIKGAECLEGALQHSKLESLQLACRLVRNHHEKWDGSGYPDGLKGEAIPLEARIMALADVYDALLSKRVYKEAMSYKAVRLQIKESAGSHFDPTMAEVMLENIEEFESIHAQTKE
ncbi:MAG: HD-GYP domain-containing protein [Candidatus Sumerlaeia bacterium]